jgi:fructose-1,6-bisphosphatase II / sedoheptulose-1,7-bisphosphatase
MLQGVRFDGPLVRTHTVVMRSISGTVRWITAEHRQLDKF